MKALVCLHTKIFRSWIWEHSLILMTNDTKLWVLCVNLFLNLLWWINRSLFSDLCMRILIIIHPIWKIRSLRWLLIFLIISNRKINNSRHTIRDQILIHQNKRIIYTLIGFLLFVVADRLDFDHWGFKFNVSYRFDLVLVFENARFCDDRNCC